MSIKDELANIVGHENILDDPATLERYSKDQSFVKSCQPAVIAKPGILKEVQDIIRLANQAKIPATPYSSGMNLRGAAIPDQGGIIIDLTNMDRIEEVNEKNRLAVIEPGVTYGKLQSELTGLGYRAMIPLGVPANRSVLSSYLERDPVLAAASFEYGNDLFLDMEVVLPTGEIFRTGNWSLEGEAGCPWGPVGFLNYRFWTGAQGTLGIVTKLAIKIEPIPQARKIFFLPFENMEKAIITLQKIQRREIGLECFGLNSFYLAAMIEEKWSSPENFPCEKESPNGLDKVRDQLSPWTLVICLSGLNYFPEEKISYEEIALKEVCAEDDLEPLTNLPGFPGSGEMFLETLLYPWKKSLKKFRYKGSCQNIAFHSPPAKIPKFENIIQGVAKKYGYPLKDISGYLLPIERGRAIYSEFDLHCNLRDKEETKLVKIIWQDMSEALMDGGAYFERPYGSWAKMVYNRYNTAYVSKLKDLKKELDPNNIMNPGKLCF